MYVRVLISLSFLKVSQSGSENTGLGIVDDEGLQICKRERRRREEEGGRHLRLQLL